MLKALVLTCAIVAAADEPRSTVVVVVGAAGTPEYGKQFREWCGRWESAARRAGSDFVQIGLDDDGQSSDRELLEQRLAAAMQEADEPLWLVLIGHGTFDGKTARFNLRGPDLTSGDLAGWLKPLARPVAIVNCASSSGPFVNELSGRRRAVITATKSGFESSFSRFGDYFSAAIGDARADLDKDEQVSLLEAFLLASSGVREFYAREGRLATEHALLDDNGDGLGTPADWFRGTRAIKTAKDGAAPDGGWAGRLNLIGGPRERQLPLDARKRRDELEHDLAELRERKSQLAEDEYFQRLEPLLVELSKLYEDAGEDAESGPPTTRSNSARRR